MAEMFWQPNPLELSRYAISTRNKEFDMYSTKLVKGIPAIERDGQGVLSVWGQDWEFANWLCELLNHLGDTPKLLLNEQDCKWLKEMDQAFGRTVQHA